MTFRPAKARNKITDNINVCIIISDSLICPSDIIHENN